MDENLKVLIGKARDGQRVQKPRTEYVDMLAALENRITSLVDKHKKAVRSEHELKISEHESQSGGDSAECKQATAARQAAGKELALAREQQAALKELISLLPLTPI
jgi:hypothetical protein